MNLTNFRQTSIQAAVEAVRSEAARHGVGIHHSELVGLVPQEALTETAARYLQLDGFKSEQMLENRLFSLSQNGFQTIEFPGRTCRGHSHSGRWFRGCIRRGDGGGTGCHGGPADNRQEKICGGRRPNE